MYNGPALNRPSPAFGCSALVVTHDVRLAGQLKTYLEQDHACRAQLASSYQDAERALGQMQWQTVFVDLRSEGNHQCPVSLLQHLARQSRHDLHVIALGEHSYPYEWAGVAHLAVAQRLTLPLRREQLSLVCQQRAVPSSEKLPAMPRVIQSASVKFKCYTPQMFQMLDHLVMMATHDVTLLLIGETGTGKTTIARLVHELSPRRSETFLTVACGALPPDLIESELFGHIRGAFTGAERSKTGKFEVAQGGSLLLDEIDTLGPDQQAKLLRVIETGEFEPVGSNDTRHSQARLIVASNVDLKSLMEQGEFRPDLYYRLNVLEFRIPPLRERPLDIVPLTLGFIEEFCATHHVSIRRIHPEFLDSLKRYPWPGNIRELKNHVRRAVLFCRDSELTPSDLATNLLSVQGFEAAAATLRAPQTLSERVACTEQEILEEALRAHNANRTATAKALGISRVGLYKKMKKYGMLNGRRRNGSNGKASQGKAVSRNDEQVDG